MIKSRQMVGHVRDMGNPYKIYSENLDTWVFSENDNEATS